MADFDVVVIGGGPAGYAAALKAAALGASVALVEAEKPGGSCVHHACIPTNVLLSSAATFIEARELDVHAVFSVGEAFNFARAVARKDALVKTMTDGISTALRMHKVPVIEGRASFAGPSALSVATGSGAQTVSAASFIVATGTRWEPPVVPGFPTERVVTADFIQSLSIPPKSAVVVGGGPSGGAFALEYATLLAIAGSDVTFVEPGAHLLPSLDPTLAEAARSMLAALGIRVFEAASVHGAEPDLVSVQHGNGTDLIPAELIVVADVRRPFFETLNLAAAEVVIADRIPVDRACRTNVAHIYAAGDVTGGVMLSSAASHMGEVAATNGTGGDAVAGLDKIPHLLHTIPEIGWIGLTEGEARARGHDVVAGTFDLSYNARAIALGAREGLVKVVAERELGEVLGVHVMGPGASEILAVAATAMQAEVPIYDLAATTHWHPSVVEGLAAAARRAL
jgi:dihydrolipoamide dehydrogenase